LLSAGTAAAQVSGEVEISDGHGRALVRSAFPSEVRVEIALWESDETGDRVELVRPAAAGLWPVEFRLLPGETQTVRLLLSDGAYPAGTVLRLETRFVPLQPVTVAAAGRASMPDRIDARLTIVTRILSRVLVR
jgi:hypothetical protein